MFLLLMGKNMSLLFMEENMLILFNGACMSHCSGEDMYMFFAVHGRYLFFCLWEVCRTQVTIMQKVISELVACT